VLAGETRTEVHEALATLDDGERLVVVCRYLLELSEAETAAALGIPPGTVKSRLHRGLRRLRDLLEPAMEAVP
jgi:RNA polymerase sigma-70 factor (ECF subfamily)